MNQSLSRDGEHLVVNEICFAARLFLCDFMHSCLVFRHLKWFLVDSTVELVGIAYSQRSTISEPWTIRITIANITNIIFGFVYFHSFQWKNEAFRIDNEISTVFVTDWSESSAQYILFSHEQNKQRAFVVTQFVKLLMRIAITSRSKQKFSEYRITKRFRNVSYQKINLLRCFHILRFELEL